MKTHRRDGFTLIELLMSIAIIAILSSLIFGGLTAARGKGNDSKTRSQLTGLKTAAESYVTTNGAFGPASDCSSGMFGVSEFSMSQYSNQANYPYGTVLKCNADLASYAVSANLTGQGGYWCVDTKGGKYEDTDPGSVTACP